MRTTRKSWKNSLQYRKPQLYAPFMWISCHWSIFNWFVCLKGFWLWWSHSVQAVGSHWQDPLVCLTVSTHEFIQLAIDALDCLHHFIVNEQSSYLRKLKEGLSPDEAIVLLDFAENYSFIIQDAVQGDGLTSISWLLKWYSCFVVYN